MSIIIPIAPDETGHKTLLKDLDCVDAEIIVSSEGGRAASLNAGAAQARGEFLWFLHADSRVTQENMAILERCLKREPGALHYFFLSFGYGCVALNAWGANVRSALFGLPYGDQGLCLSKENFERLGGFPESEYGEDLLFVRKAKKAGVLLRIVPSKLRSSGRKYHKQGWLKTTLVHQWMLFKLLRRKI
ncbi:MAG: glycosyl transferase family 2 [Alphaproteobacteria bacterium]